MTETNIRVFDSGSYGVALGNQPWSLDSKSLLVSRDHSDFGNYVIDTHDHDIPDPVWELYRTALKRFGKISTMIERDDHIPPFQDLYAELSIAKTIAEEEFKDYAQAE